MHLIKRYPKWQRFLFTVSGHFICFSGSICAVHVWWTIHLPPLRISLTKSMIRGLIQFPISVNAIKPHHFIAITIVFLIGIYEVTTFCAAFSLLFHFCWFLTARKVKSWSILALNTVKWQSAEVNSHQWCNFRPNLVTRMKSSGQTQTRIRVNTHTHKKHSLLLEDQ